ncbi:TlpA disulfide reductase family protein [Bacillus sp. FJAT-45350]|uniref:TlpA disulfide reductase family protein n=1 Tax=Bacillus sp. FJAT-45350 TaxID=2011014 RepID=UPI000BB98D70|nr:TlpA disulfide reductase family protein [Bacillus sp. FJAT-45350]
MSKSRFISAIVLLIAGALVAFLVITNEPQYQVGAEQGMIAPDFILPVWGTDEEASLEDFHGDIIVMNLWASWCPPCIKEMPDLMKLYDDYQDKGVTVLGVNMNKYERTKTAMDEFMIDLNVTIPTVIDVDGEVADDYQISALPTTYIIDREGVIQQVIRGEVNYEGLESILLQMLD